MEHLDSLRCALKADRPFDRLLAQARLLRDQGISKIDLTDLLDRLRAEYDRDADEMKYNAILDVIDRVAGFCVAEFDLFPNERAGPQPQAVADQFPRVEWCCRLRASSADNRHPTSFT